VYCTQFGVLLTVDRALHPAAGGQAGGDGGDEQPRVGEELDEAEVEAVAVVLGLGQVDRRD
jgi:hypothetical protein